jgi:signal transduction histidine kinase
MGSATRRAPSRRALWLIGLAGAAALAVTGVLAARADGLYQRPVRVLLVSWVAVPFLAGGLVAWRRRPDSRFGPLLVAAGFATLLSTLQWSGVAALNTVGQLCDLLVAALWLHVFLAYPDGMPAGRAARALVAGGYAAAVGLQVAVLALGGFGDPNLLAVTHAPGVAEALQNVQLGALTALAGGGVAVLYAQRGRLAAARPAVRLLPVAFALALLVIAALLVAGMLQLRAFEALRLATFGVVGLSPVAFLAGLLDDRLARAAAVEREYGRVAAELRRLERDLHDGTQQRLVALSVELGMLAAAADTVTAVRLHRARTEVLASVGELRDLAHGLHPAVVSGHGLAIALESVASRSPLPTTLTLGDLPRLPEPVEVAAYYVVCESLANAGKHARASSAAVAATVADGWLVVEVSDDGVGGADTATGTGLRGLADRLAALNGHLHVTAPLGRGTRIRAEVPCG